MSCEVVEKVIIRQYLRAVTWPKPKTSSYRIYCTVPSSNFKNISGEGLSVINVQPSIKIPNFDEEYTYYFIFVYIKYIANELLYYSYNHFSVADSLMTC